MDGHRIFTTLDDQLTIADFDGLNEVQLGGVRDIESVVFDQSFDAIYSLRASSTADYDLVQTHLLIPNDR